MWRHIFLIFIFTVPYNIVWKYTTLRIRIKFFVSYVYRYKNFKYFLADYSEVFSFLVFSHSPAFTFSSFRRCDGFQPDVRYGTGLSGNGPRRSARFHRATTTASQRPAARLAKAGQSVGIHGLPRQVNFKRYSYFFRKKKFFFCFFKSHRHCDQKKNTITVRRFFSVFNQRRSNDKETEYYSNNNISCFPNNYSFRYIKLIKNLYSYWFFYRDNILCDVGFSSFFLCSLLRFIPSLKHGFFSSL